MPPATIRPGSKEALRLFFRAANPPRIRPYSEWLLKDFIIPAGPCRNQRISFRHQPWVRLFAREIDRGWSNVATTGPVQSGKSLIGFVSLMLYHLCEIGEKVICGLPNLNMTEVKWTEDIRPAIMAGRYDSLIPTSGKGSRGGTPDHVELLNGAMLQFMGGGGGDKQRAGATTRVMCITETDGMDDTGHTSDEGTKIDQLLGRLRAYGERAISYAECSVTHDKGYIWSTYKAGTASKIACPCPHCGEYITPERDDFVGWQDAEDEYDAGERATFVCSKCGGFIGETARREMNENALLVHRGQWVDGGKVCGDLPRTDTLGFRWNAFNNLFATIKQLGKEEWKAAQKEDQEATQRTRNQQVWCIPCGAEVVEKVELTRGIVRGSSPGYAGRCTGLPVGEWPPEAEHRVAFVDIGKRFLPWAIFAGMPGDGLHVVNYGEHETDRPDVIGEEEAIEQALDELLPKLADHGIDVGLVDCSNWTDLIHRVVTAHGAPFLPSHGMPRYVTPDKTTGGKHANPHSAHWYFSRQESGVWVVNMDTNHFKHQAHGSLMIRPIADNGTRSRNCITLPGEVPSVHDNWASQILAEQFERVFKEGKGYREEWVKKSKNNHQLDCLYGGMVAREIAAARAAEIAEEIGAPKAKEGRIASIRPTTGFRIGGDE